MLENCKGALLLARDVGIYLKENERVRGLQLQEGRSVIRSEN